MIGGLGSKEEKNRARFVEKGGEAPLRKKRGLGDRLFHRPDGNSSDFVERRGIDGVVRCAHQHEKLLRDLLAGVDLACEVHERKGLFFRRADRWYISFNFCHWRNGLVGGRKDRCGRFGHVGSERVEPKGPG